MVEHQAGIPILMNPLSGNSREAHDCGEVVCTHVYQRQTTDGTTSLVADSALDRAANLQTLAQTRMRWMTRGPATWSEVQAALAQVNPHTLASLTAGYRSHEWLSTDGGMATRWVLIDSEARQPQAPHTVAKQWRQQSDQAVKAFKNLCGTTCACEADAWQALSRCEQDVQATWLGTKTVCALPRDGQQGRPGQGAQPDQVVDQIDGALASSLRSRQALIKQHRCVILATNELDDQQLPPQERLDGDKGQSHAEHGFRFLQDPQVLASSRYLKQPERIMALLMVMTVCWLVYAGLEYRIRQALTAQKATFPDHERKRIHHPTARWIVHYFVGIHILYQAGQWPIVRHLTEAHQHLLRLLGQPYMRFYDVRYA